jgi:hypothetical protein
MSNFPKSLKQLCTPSLVYFLISIFALVLILLQNFGNTRRYNVGSFSCSVPNTTIVFIFKLIYILFWTWVLDLICKSGYTGISWFLVLLPFILLFIIIGIFMINI